MFEIEYQGGYILIVSTTFYDELFIICLDEYNPKIVKINTYFTGLDNNMIEESIKQVLNNSDYNIDYEIEQYRKSKLYQNIKEYNQE